MIIGKHSALKGFGLFLYAVITILVLICTCNASDAWGIIGLLNTILNGTVIFRLFKYWSNE